MIIPILDLEYESTRALEEAFKLREKDPKNELLGLLVDPENDETWNRFQNRFGNRRLSKKARRTAPAQAYFWRQYFLALRKINERHESVQFN